MSTRVSDVAATPKTTTSQPDPAKEGNGSTQRGGNYKGFVAGVFSGIAKLSVG